MTFKNVIVESIQLLVTHFYDILAGTISIVDLVTDIWVMIDFYFNDHFGFFYASLAIVLSHSIKHY